MIEVLLPLEEFINLLSLSLIDNSQNKYSSLEFGIHLFSSINEFKNSC